jgi:septation ring formation regulator EzrA
MEEVFKQIAIIKEEYACTAKELQYEAKSTTDLRESTSRYEEMTREMAERSEFNETHVICYLCCCHVIFLTLTPMAR